MSVLSRRAAVLVAGSAAALTFAVPTAALAETQVFVGEGGSVSSADNAVDVAIQQAGYTKSQCTFRVRNGGFQDFEVTATCSR